MIKVQNVLTGEPSGHLPTWSLQRAAGGVCECVCVCERIGCISPSVFSKKGEEDGCRE